MAETATGQSRVGGIRRCVGTCQKVCWDLMLCDSKRQETHKIFSCRLLIPINKGPPMKVPGMVHRGKGGGRRDRMSSQRPDAEFAEAMTLQTEANGRSTGICLGTMSRARGTALERAETAGCAPAQHGATPSACPLGDWDAKTRG